MTLGVDYKRLVPSSIQSIKELKQEVEELKKKGLGYAKSLRSKIR